MITHHPCFVHGANAPADWLIGGALCAPEVWRLRGLEAWLLRLTPLCTTALLSPRRGAPVSPESPASPVRPWDVAVGHIGQGALTRPGERRTENRAPLRGDKVTDGLSWKINPAGRRTRASCGVVDSQNQSVACESRHAPTGLRAGRAPLRTHGPPPASPSLCPFVVLRDLCGKTHWQSACASTPLICQNLRNLRFPFWQSFPVNLCDLHLLRSVRSAQTSKPLSFQASNY